MTIPRDFIPPKPDIEGAKLMHVRLGCDAHEHRSGLDGQLVWAVPPEKGTWFDEETLGYYPDEDRQGEKITMIFYGPNKTSTTVPSSFLQPAIAFSVPIQWVITPLEALRLAELVAGAWGRHGRHDIHEAADLLDRLYRTGLAAYVANQVTDDIKVHRDRLIRFLATPDPTDGRVSSTEEEQSMSNIPTPLTDQDNHLINILEVLARRGALTSPIQAPNEEVCDNIRDDLADALGHGYIEGKVEWRPAILAGPGQIVVVFRLTPLGRTRFMLTFPGLGDRP